jgi:ABC-type sugar transport system ATPase subunit
MRSRATIRSRGGGEAVRHSSGGNQQKVLLERWLLRKPRVLLLNDVTRGVDVGTKRYIYHVIAAIAPLASASSGIPPMRELVGVAHRVLVMLHGCISAELTGRRHGRSHHSRRVVAQTRCVSAMSTSFSRPATDGRCWSFALFCCWLC